MPVKIRFIKRVEDYSILLIKRFQYVLSFPLVLNPQMSLILLLIPMTTDNLWPIDHRRMVE